MCQLLALSLQLNSDLTLLIWIEALIPWGSAQNILLRLIEPGVLFKSIYCEHVWPCKMFKGTTEKPTLSKGSSVKHLSGFIPEMASHCQTRMAQILISFGNFCTRKIQFSIHHSRWRVSQKKVDRYFDLCSKNHYS